MGVSCWGGFQHRYLYYTSIAFIAKLLGVWEIALFQSRVIAKYKAWLDPVHLPESEIGLFATKANFAKSSILNIGKRPGCTSDGCKIFWKPSGTEKSLKSTKFVFDKKYVH